MPNRLFVDEIISVGAVTEGDNPEAEITFWKRKVATEERERLASRGAALPDGSFPIATVADLRNAIQAFGRAKNKAAARRHIIKRARALGATRLLPDTWTKNRQTVDKRGDRMAEFDFDGFTDEQQAAVEAQFAAYEETIAGLEPVEEEDVTKDASPELQELIAKQAAELEEARAEIAKERQARRAGEFLAKAEELESVLGSPDEWGPVLNELEAAAPESYSKLAERLVAVKAQVDTGELFKELGTAGDGEQDRLSVLTKAKMELNPELTVEQARVLVRRENPELVEEERSL